MRKAIVTIVTAFVCLVIALVPRAARAGGALYLAKGGGPGGRGEELPLERTDVEVDVNGSVVSATVSQRFTSTSKDPIEVVYLFPLPQRAAVDAMEMKIGQRTVKASIAKRADARAAYDRAVQQGHRAALLEQERPNMFTFSVGNVDPGAAIDVKLHYFEVAAFDAGNYELVVPTTLGPRFNPETVADAPRIAGKPWSQKISVTLPDVEPKNGSISRLWARQTIADLERRPKGAIDTEAVTNVALAHDLVTAYTSFVAIDLTDSNGRTGLPAQVRQPSEAPADVDLGSAGGQVSYSGAPMPTPPSAMDSERHDAMAEAAPGRHGGCAGCTTARSGARSGLEALAASLVALTLLMIRRRKRENLDLPTP